MLKIALLLAVSIVAPAGLAAAQTIEGSWTVSNGELVTYARCGPEFCSRIESGAFKGQSIGRMRGAGPAYVGTVVDPESGKSYQGRAEVKGRNLILTGCVARIFCRSQTFVR